MYMYVCMKSKECTDREQQHLSETQIHEQLLTESSERQLQNQVRVIVWQSNGRNILCFMSIRAICEQSQLDFAIGSFILILLKNKFISVISVVETGQAEYDQLMGSKAVIDMKSI